MTTAFLPLKKQNILSEKIHVFSNSQTTSVLIEVSSYKCRSWTTHISNCNFDCPRYIYNKYYASQSNLAWQKFCHEVFSVKCEMLSGAISLIIKPTLYCQWHQYYPCFLLIKILMKLTTCTFHQQNFVTKFLSQRLAKVNWEEYYKNISGKWIKS